MKIKELAAMLDDYTGALSQAVEKLEIERDRKTLDLDEQMDLVGDLREAVKARRIRPLRKNAVLSLILGALLIALAALPIGLPWNGLFHLVAGVFACLLIIWGLYGLWKVRKFRRLECLWLREVEANLRRGGTVFDVSER